MTNELEILVNEFNAASYYGGIPEIVENRIIKLIPDVEKRANAVERFNEAVNLYMILKQNIQYEVKDCLDGVCDIHDFYYGDDDMHNDMREVLCELFKRDVSLNEECSLVANSNSYSIFSGELDLCIQSAMYIASHEKANLQSEFSEEEWKLLEDNFEMYKKFYALGIKKDDYYFEKNVKPISEMNEDELLLLRASELISGCVVEQTEAVDTYAKKLLNFIYFGADLYDRLEEQIYKKFGCCFRGDILESDKEFEEAMYDLENVYEEEIYCYTDPLGQLGFCVLEDKMNS